MKRDFKWKCPECQEDNIDDFELTAMPECSNCLNIFWWDDILTKNEIEQGNEYIRSRT